MPWKDKMPPTEADDRIFWAITRYGYFCVRMAPYIDIHTHSRNAAATDVVALHAYRLGVDAVEPQSPFSAGIHPWDATGMVDSLSAIREYLTGCHAIAIGEIGLDYSGMHKESAAIQRRVLDMQLGVADRIGMPVVLHCVKSVDDMVSALAGCNIEAIWHGYIGSQQQTARILRAGFRISIGPASLNSPKTVESMREIPLESLFLETDDSDVSIETVYSRVADILRIPIYMLREKMAENFTKIFPDYGVA